MGTVNRRAFSLFELLVAIAIVMVALAIILPVYKGVVRSNREVTCVSQMRSTGTALIAFAGDHQGWLPPVRRDFTPKLNDRFPALYWTSLVSPYFQKSYYDQVGQTFMRCPERPVHDPVRDPKNNYSYGVTYAKASGYDVVIDGSLIRSGVYTIPGRVLPLRELATTYILADAAASSAPMTEWPHPSGWFGVKPDLNKVAFVHGGKGETARSNFLRGDGSIRTLTVAEWKANEGGIWGEPWP